MFFLGLLSTPMPYLLLAAFYFFGFAMGMFNNKTGDEVIEPIASVTIPADVKESKTENAVYYFQISGNQQNQIQSELKTESNSVDFVPDTGPVSHAGYFIPGYTCNFSSYLFCRPPPSIC